MGFRDWIKDHNGQVVEAVCVDWNPNRDQAVTGVLRGRRGDVVLIGESAPEIRCVKRIVTAARGSKGRRHSGFIQRLVHGRLDDGLSCVLGDECEISYDNPNDPAYHGGDPCPIHDQPTWRLSRIDRENLRRVSGRWAYPCLLPTWRPGWERGATCRCGQSATALVEWYDEGGQWLEKTAECTACMPDAGTTVLPMRPDFSRADCRECGAHGVALVCVTYQGTDPLCVRHVPRLRLEVHDVPESMSAWCASCHGPTEEPRLAQWHDENGRWAGSALLCMSCAEATRQLTRRIDQAQ